MANNQSHSASAWLRWRAGPAGWMRCQQVKLRADLIVCTANQILRPAHPPPLKFRRSGQPRNGIERTSHWKSFVPASKQGGGDAAGWNLAKQWRRRRADYKLCMECLLASLRVLAKKKKHHQQQHQYTGAINWVTEVFWCAMRSKFRPTWIILSLLLILKDCYVALTLASLTAFSGMVTRGKEYMAPCTGLQLIPSTVLSTCSVSVAFSAKAFKVVVRSCKKRGNQRNKTQN